MNVNVFRAIADLALSAKRREDKAHTDFLSFYRELVETLPSEMVDIFGQLTGVDVRIKSGKEAKWGIQLTATDFIWWKSQIEDEGVRFVHGPLSVQRSMLDLFSRSADARRIPPEERKKLIALLEQAAA